LSAENAGGDIISLYSKSKMAAGHHIVK